MNNAALLAALHDSKLSYCSYLDADHARYDAICRGAVTPEAVDEARRRRGPAEAVVVRVMTEEHLPDDPKPRRNGTGKVRVPFPAFKHVEVDAAGGEREVLRSHWEGGLSNGRFRADHGRINDRLGALLWSMVERYGRKGNWRGYSWIDDMRGNALAHLMQVALQFDEGRAAGPPNPFAYLTTCISNVFKRSVTAEKRQREIADELLIAAGASPSFARQVAHEMGRGDAA